MPDYFVRLIRLPIKVEGVTVPNSDGSFSIYINELLCEEKRRDVLEHELRHIRAEHFYVDMPVEHMERQACGESINIALHPPDGKIVRFNSAQALSAYLKRIAAQRGTKL